MATVNLLNNLPIENLTADNDYLGLIDKGDLIASFLKGNKNQFSDIKMFTLYGEWGSGKSTLMKYILKEVETDFNTYFFEAWEYEKNENLAMSLLEYINIKSSEKGEDLYKDILKYGGRILRGLAKSVKINTPLYPNGPALEFDATGLVDELNQQEKLTFYQILEKFKEEFIVMEDRIKAQTQKDYNIVFIDDLDRCEPEQVLNLLSAVKLFFTYGKRTIFFCGIDKKAVEEAVKTKYGEVVKANEYLEKIFDLSFTMPEYQDLDKLIGHYFGNVFYKLDSYDLFINKIITKFLKYLNFTNPRRVKKVLNKYQFLRNLKASYGKKFPNIDEDNEHQQSLFETLLVLYLIILHEFYPMIYKDFLNFEKKSYNFSLINGCGEYMRGIYSKEMSSIPLNSFYNNKNLLILDNFPLTICPTNFESIIVPDNALRQVLSERKFFTANAQIEILFYQFIMINGNYVIQDSHMSTYTLKSVKDLLSNSL